jgi:hypothetical protein
LGPEAGLCCGLTPLCSAPQPTAALNQYLAAVPFPPGVTLPPPLPGAAGPRVLAAQQLAKRVREMVAAALPDDAPPSLLAPFPLPAPSLCAERRMEVGAG